MISLALAALAGAVVVVVVPKAYTWVKNKVVAPVAKVVPTAKADVAGVVDSAVAKVEAEVKKL